VAARLLGIPVVWQLLDTRPPMRVRKVIMPLVRALADVVMPIGHGVARAHPGAESFGDRMVVFYPPVDTETFRPGLQSTLRSELKLPDNAPVVGVVGNVNPQKGHEYFIEAAGIVRRTVPDARFVIAGHIYNNHDAYYRQLLEAADQNGLKVGEDLFFLGARSDIPNVLAGLDLFALASVPNSEGTPTVVLEAMASGVPVVATDVGSVAEVVDDGKTGFVVRSEDPVAMANRITSFLQDDGLRQRAGKAARERVEHHFSLDQCIEAHVLAYKLAIARRNRSGRGRQNE
jgi:glycosyltransferase involved in cell wall biosynthesis